MSTRTVAISRARRMRPPRMALLAICILAGLGVVAPASAQWAVTRLAGVGAASGSTDGIGSAARFSYPYGLALDAVAGVLYVADSGGPTIRRIELATGAVTTFAGEAGQYGSTDATGSAARFAYPTSLVLSADRSKLYVADASNCLIRAIDLATKVVTTLAGSTCGNVDATGTGARFNFPYGLALKTDGTTLYVADSFNCLIRAIDLATRAVTTFAGSACGNVDATGTGARFNYPYGLAVDGFDRMYVADNGNHKVRMVDLTSRQVTTLAGNGTQGSEDGVGTAARFTAPYAVTTNQAGTAVFVSDWNHAIRQIDTSTQAVTTLAGKKGVYGSENGVGTAARFRQPTGIVSSDDGSTLYVSDWANGNVRKIEVSTATVSGVAGLVQAYGSVDGVGLAARFSAPIGVAATGDGSTLLVADSNNYTIRRMALATGQVSTIAGTPESSAFTDGVGPAARFKLPYGVAVNSAGTQAFVADSNSGAIRAIDLATSAVTTLAGTGVPGTKDGTGAGAQLGLMMGISTDAAGSVVYVTDDTARRVRKLVVSTRAVSTLNLIDPCGGGYDLFQPQGLVVDPSGTNLYFVTGYQVILKTVLATGATSILAGGCDIGDHLDGIGTGARFDYPKGLAINPAGTFLYVTESDGMTIRRVELATGVVTTLAGEPYVSGDSDGVGANAHFSWGLGGVAATAGAAYVVDSNNHDLRRVAPPVTPPAVTAISPSTGWVGGGLPVTIIGTGFVTGATATIGGAAATAVVVVDATKITAVVPAHAAGTADVVVTNTDTGAGTLAGGFTYLGLGPAARPSRDADGDTHADIGVYRPSTGTWFTLDSSTANATYQFRGWGINAQGDVPVTGDFDGDGRLDPTVYRPSAGTWFILKSSTAYTAWEYFGWGNATDTLVPADYDGDGRTDAAVYRASEGRWYVRPSGGAPGWNLVFGNATDVPVQGDYDGDNKADLAVYRGSTGSWFILTSSSDNTSYYVRGWGLQSQGDTPVPADFDGDSRTDVAVYRPGTGTWFILKSSTNDVDWYFDGWGNATDVPAPADYDGDGKAELAVYRPSDFTWYVKPSSGGTPWTIVFGAAGDVPLLKIR